MNIKYFESKIQKCSEISRYFDFKTIKDTHLIFWIYQSFSLRKIYEFSQIILRQSTVAIDLRWNDLCKRACILVFENQV